MVVHSCLHTSAPPVVGSTLPRSVRLFCVFWVTEELRPTPALVDAPPQRRPLVQNIAPEGGIAPTWLRMHGTRTRRPCTSLRTPPPRLLFTNIFCYPKLIE